MIVRSLIRLTTLCLYALPVWLLLRWPWKRRPILREIMLALFAVFMTGLLIMALDGKWDSPAVMFPRAWERLHTLDNINLKPFHVIWQQVQKIQQEEYFILLAGNTLLFMPWGFCLPLLWRRFRQPLRMAGMALLLTCAIEFLQLFINRMVDVDDMLLNFVGSMAGYGLWRCLHRLWPQTDLLAR